MSQTLNLPIWLYVPLATIALLAIFLVYFAIFRDRGRGRRRCPKCWYDMSGAGATAPVRCPECGHRALTERDLARTRRRWFLAAFAFLLLAPVLVFFSLRDGARVYYAIMPKWKLVEEVRAGAIAARRYIIRNPDERGGRFLLTSHGRAILDVEDLDMEFGQDRSTSSGPRVGAGDDMNGDGVRDLAVFAYSGGAHCCYTVYVVELSDPPIVAATIDAHDAMGLSAEVGGEHNGQALFNICDWSFNYWNAPHVASPAPSVWYRLHNHHLELALDRMLKPPDSPDLPTDRATTAATLRAALAKPDAELDATLWSVMLDLIYSGNEAEARAFLDAAWPEQALPDSTLRPISRHQFPPPRSTYTSKSEFGTAFREVLEKSLQYQDFQIARAAAAKGEPIPPARVGEYKSEAPVTRSP